MKKKISFVVIFIMIAGLWLGGIIPKQIARISGTSYVKEHFPEMQLKCTNVEYASVFGDYLISFEAENGQTYSCVMSPVFFPVSMGQGLFAIESDYAENYKIQGDVANEN